MARPEPIEERYTSLSELGRGGMGVVFAAFDTVRQARVALKRLSTSDVSTPAEVERTTIMFEREYHTLSQLAHPHLISVFDYGIDTHGPYYTMEMLRGESLRALTPLAWRDAARIARDIASALALVHSRRFVHRDVTPHNIYFDSESGAKLFDFGAMIPMGVAKQLVGTPAFIAPECLQAQPLDGQTDLFALGACLYYAISGRHAYPASGINVLPLVWQKVPAPLSHFSSDIPEALEALVASLLSIEPAGRPSTAADVYEKLSSIADLPRSESDAVVNAYITKPGLVGREREREYLRKRSRRAANGRGSSVIIASARGLGRTRLLDTSMLEARLAGMRIARADASDSRGRSLGAIARILESLTESGVDITCQLRRHGLDAISDGATDVLLASERREQTLQDLTAVLVEIARTAPLAIAVDDIHEIDDASVAVLASLATLAREHPILFVATVDTDARSRPGAAQRLLWETSHHVTLRPLDADETLALISSIFGQAAHLELFSVLCQRRCLGNPHRLMQCAQAVIDANLARYEGGGWEITNDVNAIGTTLDRLTDIEQQVRELSADAMELLETLSLERTGLLDLGDYAALTSHGNSGRMRQALSELVDAGWLVVDGERSQFKRDDEQALIGARVAPERARAIHARLAIWCERSGILPLYTGFHWAKAGEFERSVQPMTDMRAYAETHASADILRRPISLEVLEIVSAMPDLPGVHPAARANFAATLVASAVYQGCPERAVGTIGRAFAEISRFTGMSDYQELHELPDAERLRQALTRANQRCQEPGIGGVDLVRNLRRQVQLCLTTGACATFMADSTLLDHLPDLHPFAALSPALAAATRVLDGLCKRGRGQNWLAWEAFEAAYAWLSSPDAKAIDDLTLMALRASTLGFLCASEAEHASPNVLAHLDQFAPLMPHFAQSLRAYYYYAIGDIASWTVARKQSDLLSVQGISLPETRNTETLLYLSMFALTDDVLGLRRVHAELVEVAAMRPGWRYREAIARCQILRCRKRFAEALEIAEALLKSLPVQHVDFVSAAVTHLELLVGAERYDTARHDGLEYLERARASEVPTFRLELMLAHASAELGGHDAAENWYQTAARALDERGVRGMLLGRCLETGARVALRRGDASEFSARSARCADHYAVKQNPGLAARFGRLIREAAPARLVNTEGAPDLGVGITIPLELNALAANTDESAFYAGALAFLAKQSGASGGRLYVSSPEDELQCVASTGNVQSADSNMLDRVAAEAHDRKRGRSETTAALDVPIRLGTRGALGTDVAVWLYALSSTCGDGRTVELMIVLISGSGVPLPQGTLEQFAALLTLRSKLIAQDPATVSTTV